MKKIVSMALLLLATATPSAWAEHKLLITDVLDAKQVEMQATLEFTRQTGDLLEKVILTPGERTKNALESNYSLGVGLGHGLELYASIPYILSERVKAELVTGAAEYEKKDGIGDLTLGGKYLLFGGEHKPVSVVTGLDVKFQTARSNHGGTGTTDISPYLAASTAVGHMVKPYAVYRATLRNKGGEDTHTVSLGAEVELNHTVTFDARFDAAFNNASNKGRQFLGLPVRGNEVYAFELASYLQVCRNVYVIPAVKVTTTGSTDTRNDELHFASATGISGLLSLYYLY